jgi:hypothetical protein
LQQSFDRALAKLVQATPVSREIEEWFANEKMTAGAKRSWKKTAFHPGHFGNWNRTGGDSGSRMDQVRRANACFPGTATAKKLLNVAAMTRTFGF